MVEYRDRRNRYVYGESRAPELFEPNRVTEFLLPFISQAAIEGREPGLSDLAKDAGLYAAGGLIGKGIQAGAKAVRGVPDLLSTMGARTRSSDDLIAGLKHPRDVAPKSGRSMGPPTYFAPEQVVNSRTADMWDFLGPNVYRMQISPRDAYKIARSKGYATADDMSRLGGPLRPNMTFDDPLVRKALEEGYIGYSGYGVRNPDAFEFTNWLVGADDIAKINPRLPSLRLQEASKPNYLETLLRRIFEQ